MRIQRQGCTVPWVLLAPGTHDRQHQNEAIPRPTSGLSQVGGKSWLWACLLISGSKEGGPSLGVPSSGSEHQWTGVR